MRVNPSRYASFLRESLILYLSFITIFFGLVGSKVVEVLGLVPTQVSLFFPPSSRVFCRGFSRLPSVSCRYVKILSKTR